MFDSNSGIYVRNDSISEKSTFDKVYLVLTHIPRADESEFINKIDDYYRYVDVCNRIGVSTQNGVTYQKYQSNKFGRVLIRLDYIKDKNLISINDNYYFIFTTCEQAYKQVCNARKPLRQQNDNPRHRYFNNRRDGSSFKPHRPSF